MNSDSSTDSQAIIDVTVRYCWALDGQRWEDLREVFLAEATADLGTGILSGVGAIIERVSSALTPLDDSQHMVTNHQVSLDGDTATCRCYLQAQHVKSVEGGSNYLVGARYEDRLVRTEDGWRIAHRDLVRMWSEGNPEVVRRG
ncbi:MAG: nuclear transport factor 2 family protein [Actinomycetota bacterium]|nr:nuclear transport factor 2 family protein [Actinomycetota bacterium]